MHAPKTQCGKVNFSGKNVAINNKTCRLLYSIGKKKKKAMENYFTEDKKSPTTTIEKKEVKSNVFHCEEIQEVERLLES